MLWKWQECRICDEKLWNTVDNLKKEAWDRVSRNHHYRTTPFQISLRDLNLFHFTRSKKLSSITDLLIHSSFTSLLAMDSGNSNSSPENILSSGGNMRIFEKGILILFKENISWQQESLFLFWSSLWFAYMSSKLQFRTQMPRRGRVRMILDYFDPNKQTDKKCTGSAGR